MKTIAKKDWEWFGHAAHFCCGRWCRFHMATKIGNFLVSSVGQYVHPRNSGASEKTESEWLLINPDGAEIGCDRFYETMVFKCTSGVCACGCGLPNIDASELEFAGAKTSGEARENHNRICKLVASARWRKSQ